MIIRELTLQHFRCFTQFCVTIEQPVVVITGSNGTGKTALCEALYCGCYARSFKTHTPRELIQFGNEYGVIKLCFTDMSGLNNLTIGLCPQKKLIKLNEQSIVSAKQLLRVFPVVIISELDMELVVGSPVARRSFIDQFLLLDSPDYATILQKSQVLVANRMVLLQKMSGDLAGLKNWTQALWQHSLLIQEQRERALDRIMQEVNVLINTHLFACCLSARYAPRVVLGKNFDDFWHAQTTLFASERRQGRSLFGAHLDDIFFTFDEHLARTFASRGQQKLLVVLLKIAITHLVKLRGETPILLLDDIMSDFDDQRASLILSLVKKLDCQLFITCARHQSLFLEQLSDVSVQRIILS